MKIVYIHGLGGAGGKSGTYKTIKRYFPNDIVLSPEVPHNPIEAKNWIKEYINIENPDVIVASSMGAFYTMQNNASIKTIVINPAMRAYTNLLEDAFGLNYIGSFKNGRLKENEANGASFILDNNYYNDLKIVFDEYQRLLNSGNLNSNIFAFFASDDELFHNSIYYSKYYKDKFKILKPDELGYSINHHMNEKAVIEFVIPKIKELL